jgi:integrase
MATVKIGTIRARKDRPGMYEATYYVNRQRRRVLGESREAVSEQIAELVKEAQKEPDIRGSWDRNVTLKEYAGSWLDGIESDIEPKTFNSYKHLLTAHVLPFRVEGNQLGEMRVRDLRRRHIKHLVKQKKADGYAKDTVRLMRSVLSSLLTDAQDDEIIDQNPALRLFGKEKGKGKEKRAEKDITPMDDSELRSFIEEAAKGEKVYGTFLITLGKTGIRPSEAIALTPFDVKADKRVLSIEKVYASGCVRPYTKNGVKRDVDLSAEIFDILRIHMARLREEYFAKGEPMPEMLFPSLSGTYLDTDNANRAFNRICRKAKLGHFRMYDLRHSFASLLLAGGAPITYVAAQLGHKKPTTTLRYYAKWLPKEGRRYVDLLDEKPQESEAAAR